MVHIERTIEVLIDVLFVHFNFDVQYTHKQCDACNGNGNS